MSRLLIGLPALEGKIEKYASRWGMVEVTPLDTALPSPAKLAKWRERVPPAFAFSVVLPRALGSLGHLDEAALATSLEAARVLQASCIVLRTPASVRPTARHRDRVAALAERLPRDGHTLVWHASGMWEPEDYLATAARAGLLPVFDAAQEPVAPGPVVYTRIQAIGHASELGQQRIAMAARALAGRRVAYVVVDKRIAGKVRTGLARAVAAVDAPLRPVPLVFMPGADGGDLDEEQ